MYAPLYGNILCVVRGRKSAPGIAEQLGSRIFDINEKLLQLAKAGKEAGIELFVMDDG